MALKDEFAKHGLVLKKNWKLIKIYFNDGTEYPFIDLFIVSEENYKAKRCKTHTKSCIEVNAKWWKSWYNFLPIWLSKRKRIKFGPLKLWAPVNSLNLLYFWYGSNCLNICKSHNYNHIIT